MKHYLKCMVGLFFTIMQSGTAIGGMCGPEGCLGEERSARFIVSDNLLKNNGQVTSYIPRDLKGEHGMSVPCDENGTLVRSGNKNGAFVLGRCYGYQSSSAGTSWRIRYSNSAADKSVPANDVVATQVFKMINQRPILWVSFTGRRVPMYASADAQKFSGANRGTTYVAGPPDEEVNQEAAQAPQLAKENCSGKSFLERAACELKNAGVENAVGTILNKSR